MGWWIGTARAGREFEVRDAIQALGAFAWVARKIEAKRVPTRRRPVAVTSPYLGRYVFLECTDEDWHRVHEVKHLGGTMLPVPAVTAARLVQPFMREIDAAYAEREARILAGERLEAFIPGDTLLILQGPLAEFTATFERIVQGATELEDRLKATVEIFGRRTPVLLDPLHVAREAVE